MLLSHLLDISLDLHVLPPFFNPAAFSRGWKEFLVGGEIQRCSAHKQTNTTDCFFRWAPSQPDNWFRTSWSHSQSKTARGICQALMAQHISVPRKHQPLLETKSWLRNGDKNPLLLMLMLMTSYSTDTSSLLLALLLLPFCVLLASLPNLISCKPLTSRPVNEAYQKWNAQT